MAASIPPENDCFNTLVLKRPESMRQVAAFLLRKRQVG